MTEALLERPQIESPAADGAEALPPIDRRAFVKFAAALIAAGSIAPRAAVAEVQRGRGGGAQDQQAGQGITAQTLAEAEKLAGLSFTDEERADMLGAVRGNLRLYEQVREMEMDYTVPPTMNFHPDPYGTFSVPAERRGVGMGARYEVAAAMEDPPVDDVDLAYLPAHRLAALIRARRLSPVRLMQVSIERARRIGPELNCIVELYEERAMAQARAAEAEIAAGRWRGPLHGLPWGAKDLISSKGDLTTWGSKPFENQRFDHDATVVERLNAAGAILLAKLSSGAMARGDVWHGERTRNPWNPQQGTGGSSAGPGAATAAAIVSFSIGTETLGSIVSPARNCGLSGLRPTFGRVSRYGVMPLSWTQDKVGPMCRSAIDCALVFEAIQGIDGRDPTAVDRPFEFSASVDFSRLRFGYVRNEFEGGGRGGRGGGRRGGRRGGGERGGEQEQGAPMSDMNRAALDKLRELGAELVPISLPSGLPTGALQFGLWVEGAAVQEEITRNGRINEMIRSTRPNQFRGLRFVPAVEYLQAQRGKMLLMEAMARSMAEFDVYVSTSGSSGLTNMTGHPVITVPMGFAGGMPRGIVFVGHLYDDDRLCAVASAYQAATDWHARRPGIG